MIVDFLPLPRVWRWSTGKLKRRINLAPHPATLDVCIMLNELMTDLWRFRSLNPAHVVGSMTLLSHNREVLVFVIVRLSYLYRLQIAW